MKILAGALTDDLDRFARRKNGAGRGGFIFRASRDRTHVASKT
jgi:hypothetical protein